MWNMIESEKQVNLEGTYGVDFDKAIDLTEYGRFHYEIIATSAISIISAGFQNGLSGYVLPAAEHDLHLTSEQIGFLNVTFLVGGISSSFMWGTVAGVKGRRKVLMATLLLDFLVTVIGAIVISNFFGFALCRFINGFLIGAPGSITFAYLAEFQPPRYRAKSVCYSGVFLTSTWLLLPLLAFAVLPLHVDFQLGVLPRFQSWRLLLIVLALPELIAGLWFLRLPESPKFLVASGDLSAALTVLQEIFVKNTGNNVEDFPVKELCRNEVLVTSYKRKVTDHSTGMVHDTLKQLKQLFQQHLYFYTTAGCSIMFSNMFGLYGLGLWLPELFARFQQFHIHHPNATVTVHELASIKSTVNKTFDIEGAVFENTLAVGVCSLVANILSGIFAGRLSLRTIPLLTMIIGGVSAGSIYFLKSSAQNLVVSCIFMSAMTTGNVVVGSVIIELFPTCLSAVAICVVICAGRLGAICSNVIFGFYIDTLCEIPIFMVAIAVLIGSCVCFAIPAEVRCRTTISKCSETVYSKRKIEISVVEKVLVECNEKNVRTNME